MPRASVCQKLINLKVNKLYRWFSIFHFPIKSNGCAWELTYSKLMVYSSFTPVSLVEDYDLYFFSVCWRNLEEILWLPSKIMGYPYNCNRFGKNNHTSSSSLPIDEYLIFLIKHHQSRIYTHHFESHAHKYSSSKDNPSLSFTGSGSKVASNHFLLLKVRERLILLKTRKKDN